LFAISQTSRGLFCFEWSSTESGPKIVNLSHLKTIKSFNNSDIINSIVNNFNFTIKNQSNSLSITIDSDNVLISCLNVDSKNISKSISWYENEILDSDFFDNYYNYYYPLISSDECLVISLPKLYKDNIINSSLDNNLNLIYLSLDIFSAATLVKQLYIKNSKEDYIIWKICNNNNNTFIVYNEDNIKSYVKLKKRKNNFVIDFHAGCKEYSNKILSLLNTILIGKNGSIDLKNLYLYQTKEDKKTINHIANLKNDNINIININSLISKDCRDPYKFMPYIENGISFSGLDL
jgi:hypothetical protein